ncbi:MAG: Gx transporter family protein [Lachnospiraceae bacterium]|nr:Gx transporter family protein [Lachnospiraceae bacterium]
MKNLQEKNYKHNISGNKFTALCGVLMALALVLSYLESLIPLGFAIPGIKLGLANIVTIIALCRLGFRPALIISVGRIILAGILFGNVTIIIYSLAGALLSIFMMYLVYHIKLFTLTGVSIVGAVFHNIGQLLVAAIVLENINILYYFLVLGVTGVIAGTFIGIFASVIMKNIHFNI